jgi:predicted nucleic acid-binding Zn ribbon protein
MHQVNQTIPRVLAELLKNAPTSPGKVSFAWQAVVGPAIARMTAVHLEGTLLLVDTKSSHWTREVGRASPVILSRLQALLGRDTVPELKIRA